MIKTIICFLVLCLLAYLSVSFVTWDWFWMTDISNWTMESRVGFLAGLILLGLVAFVK